MASGIPVSNLINITVNLAPTAAQGQSLNTMLILGTSNVIDMAERLRVYGSFAAVAVDFASTTEEYAAANLWFQQAPQPSSLNIGRWAKTAATARLTGAPLAAANLLASAWTGITTGEFLFNGDGLYASIASLNFASVTNLNGVASAIQTALQTSFAGSTFVWNASYSRFIFNSAGSLANETVSFISPPTAAGTVDMTGAIATTTLTLNGTTITVVASGATGNQINAGSAASMATQIAALVNGSADVQLAKFKAQVTLASAAIVSLRATTSGAGGASLTLAKTGTGIVLSGATLAGGTGVDVSAMLAMLATSSGAVATNAVAAETALAAVTALDAGWGGKWYGLSVPSAVDADHLAIAAYIEAGTIKHYYGVNSQEGGIITAGDITSIAYQLKQLAYDHTAVQYSSQSLYAVDSLLGRILTTQWGGNNTAITLAYKKEPGIVPETLNVNQLAALHSVNANVIVNYANGTAILDPLVVSASGRPIDTIIGLDWFAITMQTALYNRLYLSPTKIPQTDAGMQLLATDIEAVCAAGVNNGLFAPGVWNQPPFGAIKTGQFLPKGFYVYTPPVSSQSSAVRATRTSVLFQVAVCLAGSVEKVNVAVTVQV